MGLQGRCRPAAASALSLHRGAPWPCTCRLQWTAIPRMGSGEAAAKLPCARSSPMRLCADRLCCGPGPQGRRPHARSGARDHLPPAPCRHRLQRQSALSRLSVRCADQAPRCVPACAAFIPPPVALLTAPRPCPSLHPCSTCCKPRQSTVASWTGAQSTWLCGTPRGCQQIPRTKLSRCTALHGGERKLAWASHVRAHADWHTASDAHKRDALCARQHFLAHFVQLARKG